MGNPVNDKTITSAHGGGGLQESELSASGGGGGGAGVTDQGRGSGCSSSAPAMIGPVVRTICYVAAELVRLVGCVESMKPVLQSLYHRILLYPPPQHRVEAIKIMKEVRSLEEARGYNTRASQTYQHCSKGTTSHLVLVVISVNCAFMSWGNSSGLTHSGSGSRWLFHDRI